MYDVMDIIKNIENIYQSNDAFSILKDFERVLDDLDIYVYENWEDGELALGPIIKRHWVTCAFMWPKEKKPAVEGAKRLLDYDCRVSYKKSFLIEPRKILKPDDMRPGTKKGKLDKKPVWIVYIKIPRNLITDTYNAQMDQMMQKPNIETELPETNPMGNIGTENTGEIE